VPHAPVGIDVRIHDVDIRSVGTLRIERRCVGRDRRPHQGMPKPHARADLQETRVHRSGRGFGRDSEAPCREPEKVGIAARLDGEKQEQRLRGGR